MADDETTGTVEQEQEARTERARSVSAAVAAELVPQVTTAVREQQEGWLATLDDSIGDRVTAAVRENLDHAPQTADLIKTQIEAQIAGMGLVDALERRLQGPPGEAVRGPLTALDPTQPNPRAQGAVLNGEFSDFGDFLKAIVRHASGDKDSRLRFVNGEGEFRADLSGNELATGGALVPEEFRAQMLVVSAESSFIRGLAFNLPMGSARIRIPAFYDEDHSTDGAFAGVQALWTAAGASITENEPTFRQIALEANALKLFTQVENELIADSFTSVEVLLVQLFGGATGFAETAAFLGGDGAGQPLGFRNADAKVLVTRAGANLIDLTDLAAMYARMLPGSAARAVWIGSPAILDQIIQLQADVFNPLVTNVANRFPMQLLGRPLFITEHAPTLGDADDLMFVDLNFYIVADRQSMSLASSIHAGFQNDLTSFRGVSRLDAQPWILSAITPANGGDALSPFVSLDA